MAGRNQKKLEGIREELSKLDERVKVGNLVVPRGSPPFGVEVDCPCPP
jgi:hypothetical protein